ncbi:hypothetical protein ACFQZS_04025 [Mucilaginibacter calamicampi]|uniref:Spore protein YkvP/CgeB glycosyl transferase-like domain-containing protein n=1 Tax=Mucilaginibacter calamicampi TaxID=1302352 RepID=A0ABW2YXU9_9SPHI
MKGASKIVLITTGQPASNPRLVKEADSLAGYGYEVTVLYAYWANWAAKADKVLLKSKKWQGICIGGDPFHQPTRYTLSRMFHKLVLLVFKFTQMLFMTGWAISRSSLWLTIEAKRHKADLYIAHNPGALPAAVKAAKVNNALCGFDAEDFHLGETNAAIDSLEFRLKKAVETTYFPELDYFTTSSPDIGEAYRKIYPFLAPIVLLNVFPEVDVVKNSRVVNQTTHLIWFSQTIGTNRGLEDIILALHLINDKQIKLHLLGNITASAKPILDLIREKNITAELHDPLPPDEIAAFCAGFDIGLALEPGFCENNKMALSNKLFTYMQAGLMTIASDTPAQKKFFEANPRAGRTYPIGDHSALAGIIAFYHNNKSELTSANQDALQLFRTKYNWERESTKFLSLVQETLASRPK